MSFPIKSRSKLKIVTNYSVIVENIRVDVMYYYFDYKVFENSKEIASGEYESDHAWAGDEKNFLKHLKNGGAAKLALEEVL